MLLTVAALCAAAAAPAGAQSVDVSADAPAAPIAPDVITRDNDGRATIRAVRITQPLRIDGALDEALYRDERPISDFIQVEPDGGQAATERTETWVAFDEDFVYVAFKVWDSRMDALIATEM